MLRRGLILLFSMLLLLSSSATVSAAENVSGGDDGAVPSGIPLAGLEDYVDRYVEEYIGRQVVGASIVVVKDGRVILSKGYGYADAEQQIPVSQKTVMEWGSISKLAVWTAVMQLAEQGKVDLNEDIRSYLPANFLTRLKYSEPITMLNLMNHNAGFEEYMFDMAYQSPEEVRPLEEGLLLAQPAQIYKPGEIVAYSNYGSTLAAYIVERISGQPFHEYVQQHIFDPLGMKDSIAYSVVEDRPELLERKAKGYFLEGEGAFAQGAWNYMSMYPNGGNNGTAEDLAKFAMALLPAAGEPSPLFDKPETLGAMLAQSYAPAEEMPGIAHGFWEYPGQRRTLGHGGNTIAFSTNLQIVPEDRFAIIVMANQAGESHIVYGLANAIVGMREQAGAVDLPDASEVQGEFVAARRPEHGFMKLFPYLTMMKLKPQGADKLQMSLAGATASYKQVQPYLYQKVSGDPALNIWPMLYAKVSHGKVEKISVYTSDYLPPPAGRSMPVLLSNAALAVLAIAYFVVAPIVLLVQTFLRRARVRPAPRAASRKLRVGLTLTGTGLVANNLLLALRMLSNNERAYAEVYPQLLANYVLTGLAALGMAALLLSWRKKRTASTARDKWATVLPAAMIVVLVGLLVFWEFYG
ncbi:serine hydrolase domain-containing protein [Cohnella hongkongensis]|uniref:Serine hydrolase domain-containing protein n=1 Tax=Cohnella hongkongensis TaxID=178337 RepID=A0ABV9FAQ6_9BACL